ncbi:hypothetical protein Tco_0782191 [Tanacetum coccineum]
MRNNHSRYVVPTGKDNFIVSAGRLNMVSAGRTIVSPGSIILCPDDKTFIKVVSDEDSEDEAPILWSAFAGWEVISTPLGEINAMYMMDQSTKHFTTLREILHMVDRHDLLKLYGLVVKYYENHPVIGAGLICILSSLSKTHGKDVKAQARDCQGCYGNDILLLTIDSVHQDQLAAAHVFFFSCMNLGTLYVVPTGKDNFIVSAGRLNMVSAGRTIVSPGSIILGPGG